MNKLYLSILTIFLAVGLSQAQSLKAYQKAAVKAEENNNYSEALANYQVIINSAGKETADNFYHAAENARQMRVYPLAESYYLKVLNGDEAANYPSLQFWLGDIKKRLGKYDEAKSHFEQYLSTTGAAGGELSNRANKEIEDCIWAANRIQSPDAIQMQSIGTEINTASTEIAPLLRDDVLYFSSLREDPTDISCDFPVTRMYMAKTDANENPDVFTKITAGSAMQVDQSFNQGNKHTAHTAFNRDGSRIYYTLCEDIKEKTKCEIFYRTKQGDLWSEAVALPEGINHPEFTATQVSVGYDKASETEILFFASDRNGGKGGMDIWCSLMRADGKWGFPVAVPDVNTPGDDITPFFDNKSQKLFFSSDGMADEISAGYRNLGGFDIYSIKKIGGNEWGAVEHMGYPLNGGYDDMYYSINSGRKKAHFTSNRPGGICADTSEYCVCNDIYEVNMPSNINLIVITVNELTNEITSKELFNVGVELTEKNNVSFPKQAPPVDPAGNLYKEWTVDFGKSYAVTGALEGYGSKTIEFTTPPPVMGDTTITVIVPLRPQLALDVLTFEKYTGEPLNGVTVHFYELPDNQNSKSKLREEFSHKYLYEKEVDFGHRYMVIGTKEKYTSDTAYVTSEELKIIPQANLLAKLYLCEIGVTELPNVTLYFDNDIPKRNKVVPPYNVSYNKYIDDFYNYKVGGYYARESVRTPELRNFFNDEVKAGFEKLDKLAKELLGYFEGPTGSGYVEVRIEGNASNLNNKEYNKKLTQRRIKSLDEYFNTWIDKGTGRSLAKYKDRLKVQRVANGLELARKSYSNSITDVAACRDRNVRIVGINITKSKCEGAVISKPKPKPEPEPDPYAPPKIELDVMTFEKMTGDALNGVTVDFYEMSKMPTKLTKREDNANSYHYHIDFEKRYMIVGTKSGYTSDTAYVTTENIERDAATLLRELYLCKGGLNALPGVTLYFDNDEPEPDNMRTVCSYGYDRAYNEYVSSYDNRTGYYANANVLTSDMESFFDNDVKKGFADLENLAMDLLTYFESVDASAKVEITMRGHASLRSNPTYNKALTKRRISSVQNYFAKWIDKSSGRSLASYKDRIKVIEAPAGDEEACRGCYVKSAITDVKACQDRRVEIIGVQFTKSACEQEKNIYNKK